MKVLARALTLAAVGGWCGVCAPIPAARPGQEKEVKTAERVECVILTVDQKYRLKSKGGKLIDTLFVRDADSMDVKIDAKDGTHLIMTPKKVGVYALAIVPVSGAKDRENLTVVITRPEK